jgi:hypothetical protein
MWQRTFSFLVKVLDQVGDCILLHGANLRSGSSKMKTCEAYCSNRVRDISVNDAKWIDIDQPE